MTVTVARSPAAAEGPGEHRANYPQNPARAEMLLTTPLFPRVVLHRGNGVDIVIEAPEASAENAYIAGARVNGRQWHKSWIPERIMNQGVVLRFDLDDAPNHAWGSRPRDLPVDRHK